MRVTHRDRRMTAGEFDNRLRCHGSVGNHAAPRPVDIGWRKNVFTTRNGSPARFSLHGGYGRLDIACWEHILRHGRSPAGETATVHHSSGSSGPRRPDGRGSSAAVIRGDL